MMVSIGKPEVGKQLLEHLEFKNGDQYLFVDPENALHDALKLNQGVKETFFSVETPFAFLDRFTKSGGMKELGTVLSKWNKGKHDQSWPCHNNAFYFLTNWDTPSCLHPAQAASSVHPRGYFCFRRRGDNIRALRCIHGGTQQH